MTPERVKAEKHLIFADFALSMVHFWFGCVLAQIGHSCIAFTAVSPSESPLATTGLVLPEKDICVKMLYAWELL